MNLRHRKKRMVRETILEAARELIRRERDVSFSMKELAEAADVSFVTVYNYFGSKDGLYQALLGCVLQKTRNSLIRVQGRPFLGRLFAFAEAAVQDVLDETVLYRTVCNAMSTVTKDHPASPVFEQTSDLWKAVLEGDMSWTNPSAKSISFDFLSQQLAIAYRGVFSLWLCQEIDDEEFRLRVQAGTAITIFPFASSDCRTQLLERIETVQNCLTGIEGKKIVSRA